MIGPCIEKHQFKGRSYDYNMCGHVISAEAVDLKQFGFQSLTDLSQSCFAAYQYRLAEHGKQISQAGEAEFSIASDALIKLILEFDPLRYSFSISPDPSLHFLVRFPKGIAIFVETYIDIEDGSDTYLLIRKNKETVAKLNLPFDDCINEIRDYLKLQVNHNGNFYGLISHSRV